MPPKLVILRGPSASGKSTVAGALLAQATRKTCLIQQDYYRDIFRPRDNGSSANSATIHKMLQANVLMALADGYDVILEGILGAKSYAGVVGEVLAIHAHENYLFYFDVSLEETLRRHRTRPSRDTATYAENDLRTFYPAEYLPLHAEEKTIPEAYSVEEALAFVVETSGL